MIKTRFCPSPTGHIHLGNTRTALFNALLAKGKQGIFLLRIEDTDLARSTEESTQILQQDLQWLGLVWQEGPEVGGPHAPYYQSQRHAVYERYYQQLEQQGLAYSCFCTEQQLAINRKVQLASGQAPRYPGTCRQLTAEQIAEKYAQGLQPALRFHVPTGQHIKFTDLVHGEQSFQSSDLGDFIIRRADGGSVFMFCNAIDDALMGVTHALRGEDHLTNTPRQLLILQALNLPAPQYGHISLIVGGDGSRLSKRHGSRSVKELREAGYLPGALVNYLARLGHYYADHYYMELDELAAKFSFEALGSAPARFDADQLMHWQKEAIARLTSADFWQWLGQEVHAMVPSQLKEPFIKAVQHNVWFPSDALQWAQVFFNATIEYQPEALAAIHQTASTFFQQALQAITQYGTDYQQMVSHLQQTGVKGKALFQPLRAALTGTFHGPEMVLITNLLGVEGLQQRFQQAMQHTVKG